MTCPYCGSTDVVPQDIAGEREPDGIIPFSVTSEQAVQLYQASLEDKDFLPDDYRSVSRIVSVRDAYVPYWLHSGHVDFYYQFYWSHTSGSHSRQGYECRTGTYDFKSLPTDGSVHLSDDMGDTLEPYDFDELVPFSAEYISETVAERHSVALEDLRERVEKGAREVTYHAARKTVELPSSYVVYLDKSNVTPEIEYSDSRLVLLPVWFITVSYKDTEFLVGVNGQTGKAAVNLPIDQEEIEHHARAAARKGGLLAFLVGAFGSALLFFLAVGTPASLFSSIRTDMEWIAQTSDAGGSSNALLQAVVNHGFGVFLLFFCLILPFAAAIVWGRLNGKWSRNAATSSMGNVQEGKPADSNVQGKLTITKS